MRVLWQAGRDVQRRGVGGVARQPLEGLNVGFASEDARRR